MMISWKVLAVKATWLASKKAWKRWRRHRKARKARKEGKR